MVIDEGKGQREREPRFKSPPEGKEEKGKPEAVNLERDEPITTAARRRDSFQAGEQPDSP